MPNRADKFSVVTTTGAATTLNVTEAPGAGGGSGASETVIDNLLVSFTAGAATANYIIRWREATTTLLEHLVTLPANESVTFPFRYTGGLRSSHTNLNCIFLKATGTDSTEIRALVEYHYE